jgi:hypothetical protein
MKEKLNITSSSCSANNQKTLLRREIFRRVDSSQYLRKSSNKWSSITLNIPNPLILPRSAKRGQDATMQESDENPKQEI